MTGLMFASVTEFRNLNKARLIGVIVLLGLIVICVCCAEINVIITYRCDCDNYLRGYKTDRVWGS